MKSNEKVFKTNEKVLDISDIRVHLDRFTEQIVSGLKNRTSFALNAATFTKEFADGKTWILYRLKKEQDLDSEFGRYLFFDQHPLIYSKAELSQPKVKRKIPAPKITPLEIDEADKIIDAYKEVLCSICKNQEDEESYGATTKIDVENIITLNERILGLGEQVAAYKMQQNPLLKDAKSDKEIRQQLIIPEREKEVVKKAVEVAKRYNISNPDAVAKFMQKIINITSDAEVNYIQSISKK